MFCRNTFFLFKKKRVTHYSVETKETHMTGDDCLNVCKGFVTQSALGGLATTNLQFNSLYLNQIIYINFLKPRN